MRAEVADEEHAERWRVRLIASLESADWSLACASACATRTADGMDSGGAPCTDLGPWPPANLGDPCDAPAGYFTTAKDRCGFYECRDGRWAPLPSDCRSLSLPADSLPDFCPGMCVLDVDPSTVEFDHGCFFLSEYDAGGVADGFVVPLCAWDDGTSSWRVPDDAAFCMAVTERDGVGGRALDPACVDAGLNVGFLVVGDVAAAFPPGYTLTYRCAFEAYPEPGCPPNELLPPPPPAMGCDGASSAGGTG
jgi:hypothetical protein